MAYVDCWRSCCWLFPSSTWLTTKSPDRYQIGPNGAAAAACFPHFTGAQACSICGATGSGLGGMNKWQLMVLMLTAAFIMLMTSYSASREVRHLTLIAAGIVSNPTSPRLHRLPDSWNEQDKAMVATAFKNNCCPVDGGFAIRRRRCSHAVALRLSELLVRARQADLQPRVHGRGLQIRKQKPDLRPLDRQHAGQPGGLASPGPRQTGGKVTTTAPSPGSP